MDLAFLANRYVKSVRKNKFHIVEKTIVLTYVLEGGRATFKARRGGPLWQAQIFFESYF